jgi:ABC-type transport system involved in multi-copper enzyme maturation permease subunit
MHLLHSAFFIGNNLLRFLGEILMFSIMGITLKGIFRDRVFHGILVVALILPLVPAISMLSMRQTTELSITLSLSLISFILLLLAVFLGSTSLWKDIDRRYTYSVLSLPITRSSYLLGRFLGTALFLALSSLLLGVVSLIVVWVVSSGNPPDRPVVWSNLACSVIFDAIKYMLLVSIAFLFSTVSSSFFLPVFGTISMYFVGNSSQQVYDYVNSQPAQTLSLFARKSAAFLYYILPNFASFNFKVNAIYGLPLSSYGLIMTLLYGIVYSGIVLSFAAILFERKELK